MLESPREWDHREGTGSGDLPEHHLLLLDAEEWDRGILDPTENGTSCLLVSNAIHSVSHTKKC